MCVCIFECVCVFYKTIQSLVDMAQRYKDTYSHTHTLSLPQLLIVFASGYGQRPSLLDKMPPVEELETGASARQYHTNQM